MDIELTPEDVKLAYEIAERRANAGNVTEAEGVKRGSYEPLEIEVQGMMAEIGVSRAYGVEPYLEVHTRRTDGGADITYKGCTANIKSTKYFSKPNLLVRPDDLKYDVYMLCSVDVSGGLVKIQGYATKQQVKSKAPTTFKGGNKLVRVIPQSELRKVRMG